jgi:uncharacterized protein (TIGR02246 family)
MLGFRIQPTETCAMAIRAPALSLLCVLGIAPAFAGPAEEASALVDQWSATYTANDREALAKLYTPDALLFGTTEKTAVRGTDGIKEYFVALDKGGRKNTIHQEDKNVFVVGDNAVIVAGFYDFARKDQNYTPRPSRFTMLLVKRDGKWLIQHHHSSPRAEVRQ